MPSNKSERGLEHGRRACRTTVHSQQLLYITALKPLYFHFPGLRNMFSGRRLSTVPYCLSPTIQAGTFHSKIHSHNTRGSAFSSKTANIIGTKTATTPDEPPSRWILVLATRKCRSIHRKCTRDNMDYSKYSTAQ